MIGLQWFLGAGATVPDRRTGRYVAWSLWPQQMACQHRQIAVAAEEGRDETAPNAKRPPALEQMAFSNLSGGEGSRTLDLSIANAALSQLSYAPRQYGKTPREWG